MGYHVQYHVTSCQRCVQSSMTTYLIVWYSKSNNYMKLIYHINHIRQLQLRQCLVHSVISSHMLDDEDNILLIEVESTCDHFDIE